MNERRQDESLALLGCFPNALPHVTGEKAEITATLAVRDILRDASWDIWASLNGQLPMLAEAAPEEFMSSVEKGLNKTPSPFATIFAQEEGGALVWGMRSPRLANSDPIS